MAHTVFVSYYHEGDQGYANQFRQFYGEGNTIVDRSLHEEIDSDDNDYVLGQIRTGHLRNSTVTVVLIGEHTWSRKWVDWEIYSSLRPYGSRTVNGLLGIVLPGATRMPARFGDNYRTRQMPRGEEQTGYALMMQWADIAPPLFWDFLGLDSMRKRQTLDNWIEWAFQRRTRPELIDNSRPRFTRNLPAPKSGWSF